ncbi:hypothetical protein C0J29_20110 [Mycobacterium paragordonae]|jgi:hypothetical protein|uniref:PE domain-containing protein n=1 Tax=Mycobacterium paragordonae TaxID=1389713 RepID=A0ABQ1C7R4_9MYCO|nr:PE family protein [Mycobacterium paragordonae]AYE96753.1 hypothetical protein C0J29_20110 [Mycobacterium paragordonae]GFG80277.1 hypothetical protein MPRG_35530 [Mycobacterium paragordonae]
MSAVIMTPDLVEAAATNLATIGSTLNVAHRVVAAPTRSVLPAAADEVSVAIAHLMSDYAEDYQKLAGDAAAFHEQFVQHVTASAVAYANAEAASTALLQPLTAIAAPVAAAAAAAQSTLNSQIFELVTNIQLVIANIILLITAPLWLPFILPYVLFLLAFGPALSIFVGPLSQI